MKTVVTCHHVIKKKQAESYFGKRAGLRNNEFCLRGLSWTKKKRSLRNKKLRVNRASETEEQRKERLRIEDKTRK